MEKAFLYRNVEKIFPKFKLGPINLELEPGTVLGFVGPNGSGKTTTMQCLMGLLKTDAGEVEVFGQKNDLYKPAWKLEIGYVGERRIRLRTSKEKLTDHWRKISFTLSKNNIKFEAAVSYRKEGQNNQIISSDFKATLEQLRELGAQNIRETRMGVDEIAVQILKGEKNVEIN